MCDITADYPGVLLAHQDAELLQLKLRTAEAALEEERAFGLRDREAIVERLRFAEAQDEVLAQLREQHNEQRATLLGQVLNLSAQVEQLQAALWSCEGRTRSATGEAQLALAAEARASAEHARLSALLEQREEECRAAAAAQQEAAGASQALELRQERRLDEARTELGRARAEGESLVSEVLELRSRWGEGQSEAARLEAALEAERQGRSAARRDLELSAQRAQQAEERLAGLLEAENARKDHRMSALSAELAEARWQERTGRTMVELLEVDRDRCRHCCRLHEAASTQRAESREAAPGAEAALAAAAWEELRAVRAGASVAEATLMERASRSEQALQEELQAAQRSCRELEAASEGRARLEASAAAAPGRSEGAAEDRGRQAEAQLREQIGRLRGELRSQQEAAARDARRQGLRSEELASRAREREEAALAELAHSEERRREELLCMDELLQDAQELKLSLSTHKHLTRDLSLRLQEQSSLEESSPSPPRGALGALAMAERSSADLRVPGRSRVEEATSPEGLGAEEDPLRAQAWRRGPASRRSSSLSLPSPRPPPQRDPWPARGAGAARAGGQAWSHEERECTISSVLDAWEPSEISVAPRLGAREDSGASSRLHKDSSHRASSSTREGSSHCISPLRRSSSREARPHPVRDSLSFSSSSSRRWPETSPPVYMDRSASLRDGRPSPSVDLAPSSIRPLLSRPALGGPSRGAAPGAPQEPLASWQQPAGRLHRWS